MVLLSIFFTWSNPGGHQQIVLYSFCRSITLALHLAVKIFFKSFCMKICQARWPYIHLSVPCFSEYTSRTTLCYATNTIKWKHSLFDLKSSTKHKEVRPDWNDKNIVTNAPLVSRKVLPMAQVAIFKEIFDQVRKDLDCELFWLN